MLMINSAEKFDKKVKSLSREELESLVHDMANHLDCVVEDDASYYLGGEIMPKAKQTMPYIQYIMEILEYD